MLITIRAFGIARDIIRARTLPFHLEAEMSTVADLKEALNARFEDFTKLAKLSFAVNEEYVDDHYVLQENDEIVLIPPVSGG